MFTRLFALIGILAVNIAILPVHAETPVVQAKDKSGRAIQLDRLFAALKAEKNVTAGNRLVHQIWLTWHQSGRREIDDLLTRAGINVREGELQSALAKYDEIIKRAPGFAEGWNRRATLLFRMRKYERSLSDITETLKREPRHFGALSGRSAIFAIQGRHREALQAFQQALEINPFLKGRDSIIPALRKKLKDRKI